MKKQKEEDEASSAEEKTQSKSSSSFLRRSSSTGGGIQGKSSNTSNTSLLRRTSFSGGGIQGKRPDPLRINKDSQKICAATQQQRQPIIIYTRSPEVIHAKPQEFMELVQRLTGKEKQQQQPTHEMKSQQSSMQNRGSATSSSAVYPSADFFQVEPTPSLKSSISEDTQHTTTKQACPQIIQGSCSSATFPAVSPSTSRLDNISPTDMQSNPQGFPWDSLLSLSPTQNIDIDIEQFFTTSPSTSPDHHSAD